MGNTVAIPPEYVFQSFFTFKESDPKYYPDSEKLEKDYIRCCPPKEVWLKFKKEKKILTEYGNITDEYKLEFEKSGNNFQTK